MAAGVLLREIDGDALATEREMFSALAKSLSFPTYFGHNWDAIDECLRDLTWLPARGYVLEVRQSRHLWRRAPALAGSLIESWLFCAEEWATDSVPFHLVFVI